MERCSSLLLFVLYCNALLNVLPKIPTDAYGHNAPGPMIQLQLLACFVGVYLVLHHRQVRTDI